MDIREMQHSEELTKELIALSGEWESENSCYGYRRNTAQDIEDKRIFIAFEGESIVGYLLAGEDRAQNMTSIMPDGTDYFEVDELYVIRSMRSKGVGGRLFTFAQDAAKRSGAQYIMLSTATKNCRAILHFYIEEMDMTFWSAQLFKRL